MAMAFGFSVLAGAPFFFKGRGIWLLKAYLAGAHAGRRARAARAGGFVVVVVVLVFGAVMLVFAVVRHGGGR